MKLFLTYSWLGRALIALLIVLLSAAQPVEEIRYTQSATIPFSWETSAGPTTVFQDSLSGLPIALVSSPEGMPLYYYQDIQTSVCFDNKCRPLDLQVLWNITGRYLGFQLPEGEFLSRHDHQPFTEREYQRLNFLLADAQLPMRDIAFEALLTPTTQQSTGVDAISGATSKALKDFVVAGAAYTTYTLWNIVYGPARDRIIALTEQRLDTSLLALILQSPSSEDHVWALSHIDQTTPLAPQLEPILARLVTSKDYFSAYSVINAIQPVQLSSQPYQLALVSALDSVDNGLKKLLIDKLSTAPEVYPETIAKSRELLKKLNGAQLGAMLNLYRQHDVRDTATGRALAGLLATEQRYLAQKVYQFLENSAIEDPMVDQALKAFAQKR